MSWGATMSASARRDAEVLADAGLRAAERMLGRGRWLRPIPFVLDFGGAVHELELDASALRQRTPEALTNAATYLLAQQEPQSRAVALVTGTHLTAERRDAIEVWVEHREGGALTLLRPYRQQARGPRYAETRAYTGSRLIWLAGPA